MICRVATMSGVLCALIFSVACRSSPAAQDTVATHNEPGGPEGVDYRASCSFETTGVCVDVFTYGQIDPLSALPEYCVPRTEPCSRASLKGVCKLDERRGAGRIYTEHLFYTTIGGRHVTDTCITRSGRLVRYDY